MYPMMPEDSKMYQRDLELYGGKAAVLADEFWRWFVTLWHGTRLAGGGGECLNSPGVLPRNLRAPVARRSGFSILLLVFSADKDYVSRKTKFG